MNDFNTKLIRALMAGENVDEVFRQQIESAVNFILERELTAFLDYERYSVKGYNSGDSRNGYYERTLHSRFGDLHVRVPRDRNGEFKQQTIPAYKRDTAALVKVVLQLYRKGITNAEICDLVDKMYGHHYSRATVSKISEAIEADVKAFHTRPLSRRYVVIYADATWLNVCRDSVDKEALHVLLGITPDGRKEVIDYELFPTEAADHYAEMLQGIRSRGVEQVLLFVSDGLSGFRDACRKVFPNAEHQSCWVHICRSVIKKIRVSDRKTVLADLKKVYIADTAEQAQRNLAEFCEKYRKSYPRMVNGFEDTRSLFSFYRFPKEIQRSIYSTNMIENMNKQLKRITKRKEQFPNEAALDKCACCYYSDCNARSSTRIHRGFGQCRHELENLFHEFYPTQAEASPVDNRVA